MADPAPRPETPPEDHPETKGERTTTTLSAVGTTPDLNPQPDTEPTAEATLDAQEPSHRAELGTPTVIADDLNIVYKITGSGNRGTAASALQRMLFHKTDPTSGRVEVHAVRGVTFTANRGESIGLIGRNGSGKSTLLRAVAGLMPPASGAVYTSGQASLLGVNAALMDDLTGERNIVLGCLAMGMTQAEVNEKKAAIIEFSGMDEKFINLPMRTYSSGMAARLRFAIAAAKSHDILLVDEALATGDQEFQAKSEKRINELREEAGTVFVVSHSLKVITDTCTRGIWMDKGLIKLDGPVDEVVEAYLAETRRR